MRPTLLLGAALFFACGQVALADSIMGDPSAPSITSTNDGKVTASGSFGMATISGGDDNTISVSGLGASVNAQILKEGGTYSGTDSMTVGTISTTNSGEVSSTGTFNSSDVSSSGSGNSMNVLAAGTYVSLSIIHR